MKLFDLFYCNYIYFNSNFFFDISPFFLEIKVPAWSSQDERSIHDETKKQLLKSLTMEMMSSEESEIDANGTKYFVCPVPSGRSKNFENLMENLDVKSTSLQTKRGIEQTYKRLVGPPSGRLRPSLPVGCEWALTGDKVHENESQRDRGDSWK